MDYVVLAMKGAGRLVVGDAPVQGCNFNDVIWASGIRHVLDHYSGKDIRVELRDFRKTVADRDSFGIMRQSDNLATRQDKSVRVILNEESALAPLDEFADRYRVTCYDPKTMLSHHRPGHHDYMIAETALAANVVIHVGKMKTHRKAGVTGAVKNCVGINTNKDCLPHHRIGSPEEGGDEYRSKDSIKRMCSRLLDLANGPRAALPRFALSTAAGMCWGAVRLLGRDLTWEGSWPGNDTLWRTVLDLNRILQYADKDGMLRNEPQRKVLCFVDGIVAGEGEGPLSTAPAHAGVIIGGFWPASVDAVMATVMGYDWRRIPMIRETLRAFQQRGLALRDDDIRVVSNREELCGPLGKNHQLLSLTPPKYWESIRLAHAE